MHYARALTRLVKEDFFLEAEFMVSASCETAVSIALMTVGSILRALSASFSAIAVSSFLIAVLYLDVFARLRTRRRSFCRIRFSTDLLFFTKPESPPRVTSVKSRYVSKFNRKSQLRRGLLSRLGRRVTDCLP